MRSLALSLALVVLLAPAGGALGLLAPLAKEPGEIVVGYRTGALDPVTRLVATLGGETLRADEDLRFLVVRAPSVTSLLAGLLLSPSVEYAEKNAATRVAGAQWNGAEWNGAEWNGAEWNGAEMTQWGLSAIHAPAAWEVSTGERRAKLCVLDTGVAWDHPDLAANVGNERTNVRDPTQSAYDDAGHGTHIAGIAAAAVGNGIGASGVGNITILPVKVLDANGRGTEADLATGLVWCAKHDASVALMALSVDDAPQALQRAIRYAVDHDVLLVASAGNTGACTSCVAYPARHPDVLAVSAIDPNSALAPFSSRGPEVDLAAPGVDIVSTLGADGYASGSGTSQAAAFAAGAAALVRDAAPFLDASATRLVLESAARDVGPKGDDASTGEGVIDVGSALGGLA